MNSSQDLKSPMQLLFKWPSREPVPSVGPGLKSCDGAAVAASADRSEPLDGRSRRSRDCSMCAVHILCSILYKAYVTLYSVHFICIGVGILIYLHLWIYTIHIGEHVHHSTCSHNPLWSQLFSEQCSRQVFAILSWAGTAAVTCSQQPAGIIEPAPTILNIVTCTPMILTSILVT